MVDNRVMHDAPWLKIDFSQAGNSTEYVEEGWNGPEAHHRWSLGDESWLTVRQIPNQGDLRVSLNVWPFVVPPALTHQRLGISVNGVPVAELQVAKPEVFEFRIPEAIFSRNFRLSNTTTH